MAKRTKGGGSRKHGRNKKWCESYRARGQREKNKLLKQARHRRGVEKKVSRLTHTQKIGGANPPSATKP